MRETSIFTIRIAIILVFPQPGLIPGKILFFWEGRYQAPATSVTTQRHYFLTFDRLLVVTLFFYRFCTPFSRFLDGSGGHFYMIFGTFFQPSDFAKFVFRLDGNTNFEVSKHQKSMTNLLKIITKNWCRKNHVKIGFGSSLPSLLNDLASFWEPPGMQIPPKIHIWSTFWSPLGSCWAALGHLVSILEHLEAVGVDFKAIWWLFGTIFHLQRC